MLGFHYLKATPTQYVIHDQNGRRQRAGTGLAFFYFKPAAAISVVPVGSADVPFIFNEISADFQQLSVQGQLTYRISDPERVASLLNFTVDGAPEHYLSEDPEKLSQRLVNLVQEALRSEVQLLSLHDAMHASQALAETVLGKLQAHTMLPTLGIEVISLSIQAVRPAPEMARALEAEARESLLRRADEAIYDRRNSAVEQERRIKENELMTEIAVEEKKRQIRETKVEADLAVEGKEQQVREAKLSGQIRLEQERMNLITAHVQNAQAEADVQAYAIEASLKPLLALDPDMLQLLSLQSSDPRKMVSLALKEIAQNAGKIGNLNISPEVLEMLMREK